MAACSGSPPQRSTFSSTNLLEHTHFLLNLFGSSGINAMGRITHWSATQKPDIDILTQGIVSFLDRTGALTEDLGMRLFSRAYYCTYMYMYVQSSTYRLSRIVWCICEQPVNHGFLRMAESPTVNLEMRLQCRFSSRSQQTDQAYTWLAAVPVLMY